MSAERIRDLDDAIAEIDEIGRALDEIRRTSDPNRGVVCSRGCEPGCSHVAYLVEAIKAREEGWHGPLDAGWHLVVLQRLPGRPVELLTAEFLALVLDLVELPSRRRHRAWRPPHGGLQRARGLRRVGLLPT